MDVRTEIISRSEQLFLRLGVRSVTMDDIARELSISKKTLYQHFDNKDTLVKNVISTHIDREQKMKDQICRSAIDALDEVRNMGIFIISMIENISASALEELQKYYRESWEILIQKQNFYVTDCIVRNIERGKKERLYRDDLNSGIIAKMYARAAFMIVDEISNPSSEYSRRELIWELHNYHIHAIASEKGLDLWKQYSSETKFYDIKKGD